MTESLAKLSYAVTQKAYAPGGLGHLFKELAKERFECLTWSSLAAYGKSEKNERIGEKNVIRNIL